MAKERRTAMPDSGVRDATITDLARLIAGLAVPVSMEMPLGQAGPAWTALHTRLVGFGWATAEIYETALREVLDG